MKVALNSDIGTRVTDLRQQLDHVTQLLKQLEKLTEEEAISDIPLELFQLLIVLFQEAARSSMPTPSHPVSSGRSKNRGIGLKTVSHSAGAGFLWKPISDSDGKLAVLLPSGLTGNIAGVAVLSPDGRVLERGRGAGVGNGGREHFRFNRPGRHFPAGSQLEITFRNGSKQRIIVENTAQRMEGR